MARFLYRMQGRKRGVLFELGAWLGPGTLRQPNVRHHMAIYSYLRTIILILHALGRSDNTRVSQGIHWKKGYTTNTFNGKQETIITSYSSPKRSGERARM
jgi:hypothetical protein